MFGVHGISALSKRASFINDKVQNLVPPTTTSETEVIFSALAPGGEDDAETEAMHTRIEEFEPAATWPLQARQNGSSSFDGFRPVRPLRSSSICALSCPLVMSALTAK